MEEIIERGIVFIIFITNLIWLKNTEQCAIVIRLEFNFGFQDFSIYALTNFELSSGVDHNFRPVIKPKNYS